jgi:hypothetical protein
VPVGGGGSMGAKIVLSRGSKTLIQSDSLGNRRSMRTTGTPLRVDATPRTGGIPNGRGYFVTGTRSVMRSLPRWISTVSIARRDRRA